MHHCAVAIRLPDPGRSGLIYRLPIPVQPMKAVSAVLLTSGLTAGEIAATGLCLGLILVALALTGAIVASLG